MKNLFKISLVLLSLFFAKFSGAQWIKQSVPFSFSQQYVKFFNADTGLIFNNISSDLVKTTNGGSSWISRRIPYFTKLTNVINDSTVIGIGSNLSQSVYWLIKTVNSGTSWDTLRRLDWYYYSDMYFVNEQTGWISARDEVDLQSKVWRTTNGGVNFYPQLSNPNSSLFIKLSFQKDPSDTIYWGLAVDLYDSTKLTTNSGITWTNINNFPEWQGDMRVKFLNKNTGYISNYEYPPALYKTTNGGFNWISFTLPYNSSGTYRVRDFAVLESGNIIYCVGGEHIANGNAGFIWKSTTGGNDWLIQNFDTVRHTGKGYSVDFISANIGWAICQSDSVCYKTINGGGTAHALGITQLSSSAPDNFSLSQNYPNPFNPSTKINYEIKSSAFVSLKVFDMSGKEVASLVNEKQNAGSYEITFDGSNLSSGIYFYTLQTDNFKDTRKMILVK